MKKMLKGDNNRGIIQDFVCRIQDGKQKQKEKQKEEDWNRSSGSLALRSGLKQSEENLTGSVATE